MASKRSIGATLVLSEGNFFTNAKKVVDQSSRMKSTLGGVTSGLGKQNSALASAGGGLASMAKKVVGVVAAYAGARQIVDFGKSCVEAANGQIKAEERLSQLMMNVKGTTTEAVDSVKQYAAELQGLTTVGDEVSMVGGSQLATFKLQSDSIKKLMPAMNDLAVGTYGVNVSQDQMQQTANLVGKVMQGQVGALTRVGVTFDETQAKILKNGTEAQKTATLVDVLGQNYGGLAERMAKTPEGRIVQLKNAWGDVQEVIGMKLYPMITDLFGWLATKIPVIQDKITNVVDFVSPYVQKAVSGIKTACQIAGDAVKWVADNWNWLGPVLTFVVGAVAGVATVFGVVTTAVKVWTSAQKALNFVMMNNPIGITVLAVAALVGAFVLLWNKCEPFRNFFIGLWEKVKQGIQGIIEWVGNLKDKVVGAFSGIKEKAGGIWNNIKETAGNALEGVKSYTSEKLGAVKQAYDEHGGGIKGTVFAAMEGVKQYYSMGYDAINTLTGGKLGQVVELTKNKFNDVKKGVQDTFGNIRDFVKGVWTGISDAAKGAVNKIIGALNGMIGGINKIQFKMPDWMGGKSFGINIPTIPMLASGGTITRPGSVLVGENGPEILNLNRGASVVPLDRSKQETTTNHNTFHITIYASEGEAPERLVREIQLALNNM